MQMSYKIEMIHLYNKSDSGSFCQQDFVGVSLLWLQLCPRVLLHPGQGAGAVQRLIGPGPSLYCRRQFTHYNPYEELNARIALAKFG